MTRVASLYLPQLAIDRLRRVERLAQLEQPARRPDAATASLAPRLTGPIDDNPGACSVPRGGGWRPGARWARDEGQRPSQSEIDALPAHQRPTMREMGRRSEAAEHPFRAMPADEGGASVGLAPLRSWTRFSGAGGPTSTSEPARLSPSSEHPPPLLQWRKGSATPSAP